MRLRLPSRLSWKLIAAILPPVIAGVSVIVWLQYSMARRELLGAVDKEMQFQAQRAASGLDDLLDQRRRDLFTLAETPLIADYYRNVDFISTTRPRSTARNSSATCAISRPQRRLRPDSLSRPAGPRGLRDSTRAAGRLAPADGGPPPSRNWREREALFISPSPSMTRSGAKGSWSCATIFRSCAAC